jgi:hypothetical protein
MSNESTIVDWAALAVSIIAAGIALAAVMTSCNQSKDAHLQLLRQFSASVSFAINKQAGKHRLGIGIENAGPGVAHVKSVTYYVDGKRTEDISNELERRGMDTNRDEGETFGAHDYIGPGATKWLIDYRSKGPEDEQRVGNLILDHIQAAVEYCDANDKCERLCSEEKKDACP